MSKLVKVPKAAFRGERYRLAATDGHGRTLPQSSITSSLYINRKDDELLDEFDKSFDLDTDG